MLIIAGYKLEGKRSRFLPHYVWYSTRNTTLAPGVYASKYAVFGSAGSYSHVTPGLNTTAASQK
jgi:hypothetical protein